MPRHDPEGDEELGVGGSLTSSVTSWTDAILLEGDAANRVTRIILNALTFSSDCSKLVQRLKKENPKRRTGRA